MTRLRADGRGLIYSGYLGGDGMDYAVGLAVDKGGGVYITGYTTSDNFPVKDALYPDKDSGTGNSDAFLSRSSKSSILLFICCSWENKIRVPGIGSLGPLAATMEWGKV